MATPDYWKGLATGVGGLVLLEILWGIMAVEGAEWQAIANPGMTQCIKNCVNSYSGSYSNRGY